MHVIMMQMPHQMMVAVNMQSENYDCAMETAHAEVKIALVTAVESAEVDECDVCNGDGPEACWDGSTACDHIRLSRSTR